MKPYMSGLVELTPGDAGQKPIGNLTDYAVWTRSDIRGMRLRASWGFIKPTRHTSNYSIIDEAVNLANQHNKRLSISVQAGYQTPQWVYEAGVKPYASANGQGTMPLPWDELYQELWFATLSEFAEHVPPGSNKTLSQSKIVTEFICAGFMTECGMYLGDAADEELMPHEGYDDVHDAYRDSVPKILTHQQKVFSTTPLEITYVAPFNTPEGQEDGKFIKDWFIGAFPGQAGTMVSSVFAVDQPAEPQVAPFPHGGQCYKQVYQNKDPAKLYEKNTPLPDEFPPYPGIFVKTCQNAAAQAMAKLEIYTADAHMCPDPELAEMNALLMSVASA